MKKQDKYMSNIDELTERLKVENNFSQNLKNQLFDNVSTVLGRGHRFTTHHMRE